MTPIHNESMMLAEVAAVRKPNLEEPRAGHANLVQAFFNVNIGKGHRGLKLLAGEYDIDVDSLIPGQYVAFINRRKTSFKLYTAGNTLTYTKLPDGMEVTDEVISQIPALFQAKITMEIPDSVIEALEGKRDNRALTPGRKRPEAQE